MTATIEIKCDTWLHYTSVAHGSITPELKQSIDNLTEVTLSIHQTRPLITHLRELLQNELS